MHANHDKFDSSNKRLSLSLVAFVCACMRCDRLHMNPEPKL